MDLSILTDTELALSLGKLTGVEREVTLKVLYHLIELERRGCFRDEGYSSLFDYCTRKLSYSEGCAYKRITASRCLRDNPELGELFAQGKVNLCTLTTAARALRDESTTVEEIVGKSKREVERLVAQSVEIKPRERVKPIAVIAPPALPLFVEAAKQPEHKIERRYELKFSVSEEVYKKLESAKAALSNALGSELSLEVLLDKLLDIQQRSPKTRGAASESSNTRYIPKAVKRAVISRDLNRCSFRAPDGTRCIETHYLQFDHIVPFSCGGKSELENLRLLCPAHNMLLAERYFGREKMQRAKTS